MYCISRSIRQFYFHQASQLRVSSRSISRSNIPQSYNHASVARKIEYEKNNLDEVSSRYFKKLETDISNSRRVQRYEIESLLRVVELSGRCDYNQTMLIIKSCGEILVDVDMNERSRILQQCLDVFARAGVSLDISHYNAILKVHLDNHSALDINKFLQNLEKNGKTPNRLTLRYCHSLACQQDNLALAEDYASKVSGSPEYLHHNLLTSHIRTHNDTQVRRILSELGAAAESPELQLIMIREYSRVGDLEKVKELLSKTNIKKFEDAAVLSIIVACCQGGLDDLANDLSRSMIKKKGFAGVVRNYLPLIARTNNVALTAELFHDKSYVARSDSNFLTSALTQSTAAVEDIVDALMVLHKKTNDDKIVQIFIVEAAKHWSQERCVQLMESLRTKFKDNVELDHELVLRKLSVEFRDIADQFSEVCSALEKIHAMGLRIPFNFISKVLLPSIMDLRTGTAVDLCYKVREHLPHLNWSMTTNLVLASLFNMRSSKHLAAAGNLLLNIDIGYLRPKMWFVSLAATYQETRDVDNFVNVFIGALQKNNLGIERSAEEINYAVDELYRILVIIVKRTEDSSGRVIQPILEQLRDTDVGVPEKAARALTQVCDDEEVKRLIETNRLIWTQKDDFRLDRDSEMVMRRRQMSKNTNFPKVQFRMFDLPESKMKVEEMYQMMMTEHHTVSKKVIERLMMLYLQDNETKKALEIYQRHAKDEDHFYCAPTLLNVRIILNIILRVSASLFKFCFRILSPV